MAMFAGVRRPALIIGAMMRKLIHVHVAYGALKSGKAFDPASHGVWPG